MNTTIIKSKNEAGFITVLVMMLAALIVVLLNGALHANYHQHKRNQLLLQRISERLHAEPVTNLQKPDKKTKTADH